MWVPTTAETLPSRKWPIAFFSEEASPWKSTMMTLASWRRRSTSARPSLKGSSRDPFMKTRPERLRVATATPERLPFPTCDPLPGWRSG